MRKAGGDLGESDVEGESQMEAGLECAQTQPHPLPRISVPSDA